MTRDVSAQRPGPSAQPLPLPADRWKMIEGVRAHYVTAGIGRKVLLLHGWGASLQTWEPVSAQLVARGFQTLALDFPGFGQSALPPAAWGVPDYARWLHIFL